MKHATIIKSIFAAVALGAGGALGEVGTVGVNTFVGGTLVIVNRKWYYSYLSFFLRAVPLYGKRG